jgi:hypothetical protein
MKSYFGDTETFSENSCSFCRAGISRKSLILVSQAFLAVLRFPPHRTFVADLRPGLLDTCGKNHSVQCFLWRDRSRSSQYQAFGRARHRSVCLAVVRLPPYRACVADLRPRVYRMLCARIPDTWRGVAGTYYLLSQALVPRQSCVKVFARTVAIVSRFTSR